MARYGHQPLSEIRAMTARELDDFRDALAWIVEKENRPSSSSDSGA